MISYYRYEYEYGWLKIYRRIGYFTVHREFDRGNWSFLGVIAISGTYGKGLATHWVL